MGVVEGDGEKRSAGFSGLIKKAFAAFDVEGRDAAGGIDHSDSFTGGGNADARDGAFNLELASKRAAVRADDDGAILGTADDVLGVTVHSCNRAAVEIKTMVINQ